MFGIVREIGELARVVRVIVELRSEFALVPFRVAPAFRAHVVTFRPILVRQPQDLAIRRGYRSG